MANPDHVEFLLKCQGEKIYEWNAWRKAHPVPIIDLNGADLSGANLPDADLSFVYLSEANLSSAHLRGANLWMAQLNKSNLTNTNLSRTYMLKANLDQANLTKALLADADLSRAYLTNVDLSSANLAGADLSYALLDKATLIGTGLIGATIENAYLRNANLSGAVLERANLTRADLTSADMRETNLNGAILVNTILKNAHLDGSSVYGVSVWDVDLENATQLDLIITPGHQTALTVDNLKIAQFIYLILNNTEIRDVIDTVTSKAVLILGNFNNERKPILEVLKAELRNYRYYPMLFDFNKPSSRDLTETVRTLANLSHFVIADLTSPRSVPHELQAFVPGLKVPVQPLLLEGESAYAMFGDLEEYPWMLPICSYRDETHLFELLHQNVIEPAEALANSIAEKRLAASKPSE